MQIDRGNTNNYLSPINNSAEKWSSAQEGAKSKLFTSNNLTLENTCTPLELRSRLYIRVPASVARFPRRKDDGELRTVLSSATEGSRMEQPTMFGRGGHRVFPSVPLIYALCPPSTFSLLLPIH